LVEAYIDESGTDGRGPGVCVAGYLGHRDAWRDFERAWRRQLRRAGVECFHAKERSSHPLWEPMLRQILGSSLRGMMVTVAHDNYRSLMGHRPRSTVGNQYAACTYGCAMKLCGLAKRLSMGPVAVVIEDGQPNVEFVVRTLGLLIGSTHNVASVTIAKKSDFLPLQTADFLAHCGATYQRDWLEILIGEGAGRAYHGHYDKRALQRISRGIDNLWKRAKHQKQQARLAARLARRATAPPAPKSDLG